jgi:hypothetical protein
MLSAMGVAAVGKEPSVSVLGAGPPLRSLAEFATDTQRHINRQMRCAIKNEVSIGLEMKIG